ncbi:MAG TPA: malonyl-CoA decarboxylase family protein, partial [Burkholderiaceae bacterium]|nr:malonyl-CoA decarboxylase family protein [Burkholderiaceae bacterium]
AVEADLLHLLSSWFNAGFLQMRRVDWRSPAQLLEQIIRHEAVHRSTAGTTCVGGCSPTGAASDSSTRSCPTSR